MKALTLAVLTLLAVLAAPPAYAQEKSVQSKPADTMPIVLEKMRADKKLLVAENVQMTESEAKAFWPVYESYQRDLARINDRLLNVINDYAANYQTMSDEVADKLVREAVAIEADRTSLMKSYLPKFSQVLPARKVARYYQIESKVRAAINYELAAGIPLVK